MADNIQRVNAPEEAVKAIRSKSAPTAKQAERAKQASRAITLDEVKQLRRQNPKQVDTFLSNYNDPTELNSFIDALTNREAVSKKFGDTWGAISTTSGAVSVLSFAGSIIAQALATFVPVTAPVTAPLAAGLKVASKITAIPSIPAAVDVAYNKGIKPIAAGKSQEALLNTLMNLGETADYITNPIKGGILEGSKGFIKGTGLSDVGRVNYDFDTGFFLTDMLLEAVVDPLNWIDFGTSKLLKQNIKPLADNVTSPIITALSKSDLAGTLTEQNLDNISSKLSKTIAQVTQNYQTKMLNKKLTKAAKKRLLKDSQTTIQRSLVNALKKELPEMSASQLTDMLALANKSAAKDAALNKTMKEISNIAFDKLSTDTIKSLEILQNYSNSYQEFMTKNAFMTSGYGLGVEAAINGWKGINAWANNLTINRLTKATIFDYSKGLDITQYQKAKNIWETSSQYVLEQTSEVSQRDINAFYNFMNQQLNRDRQAIMHIMQDSSSPLKKSARIAAVIQELNPKIKDLNEYIDYIKQINDAENGIYKQYIDYFTNVQSLLKSDAFTKPIDSKLITTADKLWQGRTLATMQATQDKVVDKVTKIIPKNPEKLIKETDKQFALKLNNEFVTTAFLFDPDISAALDQIVSDEGIGALLNKIAQDINALAPEVAAPIANAPTIIKQTGINFRNLKEFYSDLAMTPLQEIAKVHPDDFKRYILDQIFNHDGKTITELLAEFDSITMPALKNGLETMLSDVGFTFKDYPILEDQIAGVYKRFLQLQQASGIDYINATITPQFTQSIDDLIKYMPDYAEQLQMLSAANKQIKTLFNAVENINLQLLNSVFTDTNTIFNTAKISTRQLSDAGLALSTVGKTANLKYFNISQDISGSALREINNLGESINRMKNAFDQYSVYFTDTKRNKAITKAYNAMRELLRNKKYTDQLGPNAFYYLKETEDATMQFIQLSEFAKLNKDETLQKIFKRDVLQANLKNTTDYLNILNPSRLLVTDFAWNPTAQSAHFSEIKLNKSILESIKQYENLSLGSKKITNDFQAVKDILSTNKADRPKMLQQERYIKAASALNNYLEYFQEKYASLFNKNMATESLENIRNIFLNFPELNKKYGELVDTLEKYWNGEIDFKQSAKSEGTASAARMHKIIDDNTWIIKDAQQNTVDADLQPLVQQRIQKAQTVIAEAQSKLEQLKAAGFDDEFTPFWGQIKEMNTDIFTALGKYNQLVPKDKRISYTEITPWDPFKQQQQLNKLINRATDANAKGAIYNLFNLTPEQFKNELAYRMRFITMHEDDVADPQLKVMMNKFNKGNTKVTSTEFVDVYKSANGWYNVHDKSNHRYWYLLDPKDTVEMSGRQAYLNGNTVVRLQKPRNFNEFAIVDDFINDPTNPGTAKTLNELSSALETLTGTALGDSQGDTLTQNFLEQLYTQMPKEVQDLLPKLEVWTDQSNFQYCRYNESILGTMSSKNKLGTYSSNMIINARNAIQQAQCYLKPKNEYVNSVFDSMLSISSPNSIYSRFSDNDLLEALQANPEYKLVVTAYHKKYGLQVREILPTSIKAIQKAKQLGGWVIPLQTYKDVYAVLNHRLGSEGFAKLWSRIMYTYKFGYLCRPGAWIRNFIDTNLKSKLELGNNFNEYKKQAHGILDDINSLKAYVKDTETELLENAQREYGDLAFRLFEEKDRIEKFIQRRSKDGYIREDTIKEWFANNNAKYLTYEAYQELNSDFLSQGISGNIMAGLDTADGGDAWNTFTQLTGNIIETNNKTENYNRLAVYLYELDRGNDYTTALSKIAKTHFDYSFKSKAEQLADLVFPFTTFTMRNFSYWIEQLEKHPWIMRNYAHLMKPFWSFKDFTPQELATNKRLQTQILYGQLPLVEFNNKVLTFKLNPSIQDAIQMFSDPINNIYEKLAAPIAQPIAKAKGERTNINNMIPIIGPAIQSAKTMINTGAPIPSLIGVQPALKRTGKTIKFTNSNLSGIDQYTDNTYRTPKYRKNIVYDSYATKGVKRYRLNLYPIVDIAHDIKMRYSVNVYNRVKNRVQTDVYNGIRYRIRLDANRFR